MQTVSQLESLIDQPLLFLLALVFGLPQAQAPSAPPSRANSLVIPALSVTTLLSTRNQSCFSAHLCVQQTCVTNTLLTPRPNSRSSCRPLLFPSFRVSLDHKSCKDAQSSDVSLVVETASFFAQWHKLHEGLVPSCDI